MVILTKVEIDGVTYYFDEKLYKDYLINHNKYDKESLS